MSIDGGTKDPVAEMERMCRQVAAGKCPCLGVCIGSAYYGKVHEALKAVAGGVLRRCECGGGRLFEFEGRTFYVDTADEEGSPMYLS